MKNEVARFMLKEIDARIAKRRRAIDKILNHKIDQVRFKVERGYDLDPQDSIFLEKQYERFSDPDRLKWGAHVRI